jgi:secreted trypsin-like serine protease
MDEDSPVLVCGRVEIPMTAFRRTLLACAIACASLTATAAPSFAIVGGSNATANEFPAVAQINFGFVFQCTGTLISPDTVLTAGHCASMTSSANFASPAAYPPQTINVRIGHHQNGTGGEVVPVSSVIVQPSYVGPGATHDISLLKLSRNSVKTPVKVAGSGETGLWAAGTNETIVGWGVTRENGSSPNVLQKATVPIVADATCESNYSSYGGIDETTEICAGYPQGGTDTCQGDSGGPLFGHTATGELKVVGATSYGDGCARPGKPGVYARVADTELREWIRSVAPAGVD